MVNIETSNHAKQDLIDIWLFIAEDNSRAADLFLDKLGKTVEKLANLPFIGLRKKELELIWPDKDIRLWPVDSYIIVYENCSSSIRVLRVFNSSLDYTRLTEDLNTPPET